MMDINEIREYLPHRYPFLLVDRVVELDTDAKRIRGYKNVTINEPFFNGHFPQHPIMPGVLIIEALSLIHISEPMARFTSSLARTSCAFVNRSCRAIS